MQSSLRKWFPRIVFVISGGLRGERVPVSSLHMPMCIPENILTHRNNILEVLNKLQHKKEILRKGYLYFLNGVPGNTPLIGNPYSNPVK